MGNLSVSLREAVTKETSKKMQPITKEAFKETLETVLARIENFKKAFTGIPASDLAKFASKIQNAGTSNDNIYAIMYCDIAKKTGNLDIKSAFSSYLQVIDSYIYIFGVIERNVANIFKEKAVTIYNSRLSHTVVFALVDQANRFVEFSNTLFDGVMYDTVVVKGVKELPAPKRYKYDYLNKNKECVISIINNMRTTGSAAYVTNMITDFKKPENDACLIANNNEPNTKIEMMNFNPQTKGFIQYGFGAMSFIFKWIGEIGNVIRHIRYQKMIKEKEWLESHVALLKLALMDIDPDSDEYRKQVKIIETYNEIIAELDRKIREYEEGR